MLCRILMAIRHAGIRRHVQKSPTQPGVVVDVLSLTKNVWQQLANANTDCVIIDRALIPRPVSQSIGAICQLPEPPPWSY